MTIIKRKYTIISLTRFFHLVLPAWYWITHTLCLWGAANGQIIRDGRRKRMDTGKNRVMNRQKGAFQVSTGMWFLKRLVVWWGICKRWGTWAEWSPAEAHALATGQTHHTSGPPLHILLRGCKAGASNDIVRCALTVCHAFVKYTAWQGCSHWWWCRGNLFAGCVVLGFRLST